MLKRAHLHLPYAGSKTSTCQLYRCSSIMPGVIPIAVQSALNLAFCNLHLGKHICTLYVSPGVGSSNNVSRYKYIYWVPFVPHAPSVYLLEEKRKIMSRYWKLVMEFINKSSTNLISWRGEKTLIFWELWRDRRAEEEIIKPSSPRALRSLSWGRLRPRLIDFLSNRKGAKCWQKITCSEKQEMRARAKTNTKICTFFVFL